MHGKESGQAAGFHNICDSDSSSQQDLLNRRQMLQFTSATALLLQYRPEAKVTPCYLSQHPSCSQIRRVLQICMQTNAGCATAVAL